MRGETVQASAFIDPLGLIMNSCIPNMMNTPNIGPSYNLGSLHFLGVEVHGSVHAPGRHRGNACVLTLFLQTVGDKTT